MRSQKKYLPSMDSKKSATTLDITTLSIMTLGIINRLNGNTQHDGLVTHFVTVCHVFFLTVVSVIVVVPNVLAPLKNCETKP